MCLRALNGHGDVLVSEVPRLQCLLRFVVGKLPQQLVRVHSLNHDLLLLAEKFAVTKPFSAHVLILLLRHLRLLSGVPRVMSQRRAPGEIVAGGCHLLSGQVDAVAHQHGADSLAPPLVIRLWQREWDQILLKLGIHVRPLPSVFIRRLTLLQVAFVRDFVQVQAVVGHCRLELVPQLRRLLFLAVGVTAAGAYRVLLSLSGRSFALHRDRGLSYKGALGWV